MVGKNLTKWVKVGTFGGLFHKESETTQMNALARILYVGKHQRNLDSKNRLTIPSKWRFDGDTEDVYLALPDPDGGCIRVLPPKQVQILFDKIENQDMSNEEANELNDKLFSQALSFGCDKQGRMNLSEELLNYAGITKEAIIVGRMKDFRIYSPEKWADVDPNVNKDDMGKLMRSVGL